MFATLFRALSTFIVVIGFLSGATAVYALIFGNNFVRFAILFPIGLVLVVVGIKMRARGSEQRIVGVQPEEIANDFSVAKAIGLGAHASPAASAAAGAIAGALVVIGVNIAGMMTARALPLALLIFALFGAALALMKRKGLQDGRFYIKNGRRFGPQRRLSQILIPVLTVSWLVLSAPEADPVILGLIAIGTLWWIGAAFDFAWDVLHITLLVLIYGEHATKTVEWGLREWLRHTRADARVYEVSYNDGDVLLKGEFDKPDELLRDLRKLDFVRSAKIA